MVVERGIAELQDDVKPTVVLTCVLLFNEFRYKPRSIESLIVEHVCQVSTRQPIDAVLVINDAYISFGPDEIIAVETFEKIAEPIQIVFKCTHFNVPQMLALVANVNL